MVISYLTGDILKLPKINDVIKINCHRKIKNGGKLKSVTITKEVNGYYYASLLYEYPVHTFTKEHVYKTSPKAIGLDMKLGELYIDSNGNSAINIKTEGLRIYHKQNKTA